MECLGGPVFLIANRLAITVALALSWEGNTTVSYESSYWFLTVRAFIQNQFTERVVRYLFCLPALKHNKKTSLTNLYSISPSF